MYGKRTIRWRALEKIITPGEHWEYSFYPKGTSPECREATKFYLPSLMNRGPLFFVRQHIFRHEILHFQHYLPWVDGNLFYWSHGVIGRVR